MAGPEAWLVGPEGWPVGPEAYLDDLVAWPAGLRGGRMDRLTDVYVHGEFLPILQDLVPYRCPKTKDGSIF